MLAENVINQIDKLTYRYEKELVEDFLCIFVTNEMPWPVLRYGDEFFYGRGKTDVVALAQNGKVLAFEAKLKNWRYALQQAYRNTCFSHLSYVLLPYKIAVEAWKYQEEFSKRKVGICYIIDNQIIILHEAIFTNPIQPSLSERAIRHMSEDIPNEF